MPGTDYHIYRLDTGEIVGNGRTKFLDDVRVPDGCRLAQGRAEPSNHYCLDGAVTVRPVVVGPKKAEINADGLDSVTFTNLPADCQAAIDEDDPFTVSDGELIFTTRTPGTYCLRLEKWPAQPHKAIIIAT